MAPDRPGSAFSAPREVAVVERYYRKPRDQGRHDPFRSDGFLRDATLPGAGGADVPLASLPPFLRALLVTDGTVTKILEAYFWEPVEVRTLEQAFSAAERSIDPIGVAAGDGVLIRRAQLAGRDSDRTYVNAVSVIRTRLIPAAFRQRLIDREIGIGALIRDSGLESYREVLEIGLDRPAGRDSSRRGPEETVYRTYRIIIEGEPVILITETFPLALYRGADTARGDNHLARQTQGT
jgi:chorismate-pyruvate lyase